MDAGAEPIQKGSLPEVKRAALGESYSVAKA